MSVEEIITAIQQLPGNERKQLIKSLGYVTKKDKRLSKKNVPSSRENRDAYPLDRIPPNRDREMQWLIDNPEFWQQHRGEHVALWGYEMIAVGKTRKEVAAEALRRGIRFPFIQYIPENKQEWLLGRSNQLLQNT